MKSGILDLAKACYNFNMPTKTFKRNLLSEILTELDKIWTEFEPYCKELKSWVSSNPYFSYKICEGFLRLYRGRFPKKPPVLKLKALPLKAKATISSAEIQT